MSELILDTENDQAEFPSSGLIKNVIRASLRDVDPYRLVAGSIVLSNGNLCIGKTNYLSIKKVILIAMGKASLAMTRAAVQRLGERIDRGVCVTKVLPETPQAWQGIEIVQGGHPIPNAGSLRAGQKIQEVLQDVGKEDLVLVLVSGGASALVSSPYEPISLTDLQATNRALVRCGANINEINSVRKHLEALKGGGLLRLAQPARVHALILSDVIGDDLSVIASGPTVADETTFADAWEVVQQYQLALTLPESVLAYLRSGLQGEKPETLKAAEIKAGQAVNEILAGNHRAMMAALNEAAKAEYGAAEIGFPLTGEARDTCAHFFHEAEALLAKMPRPAFLIGGGETTVTVKGNGLGGRNLEFALAAVAPMQSIPGGVFFTLATDGEDGPTDAAGAVVTDATYQKAQALGLNPQHYLDNNDAYSFFAAVGGLIKTGSTGTNVNDLAILIVP